MKKFILLALMALLISFRSSGANEVAGNINLESVPLAQVLDIYKGLAKSELVISSELKKVHASITLLLASASRAEAAKAIEKALLEQAGVVITPLDDKRTSVTFNDALPLTPTTQ